MKGFKKEWKISLEPRSIVVLTMRFEKSEEQHFTENDAFAKDRETSFQNTMFYKLKIVYPIFYDQDRFGNHT